MLYNDLRTLIIYIYFLITDNSKNFIKKIIIDLLNEKYSNEMNHDKISWKKDYNSNLNSSYLF